MITIREITPSETWPIRHRVMWPDMPASYVQLEEDFNGIHFGLFEEENLISVVSLFVKDGVGQFRKFATEITEQGKGYGAKLLAFLVTESRKRELKELWCNARVSAFPFYQRQDFEVVSETWEKDGVAYGKMRRVFN
ncbi:Acetyltransferase (GNAT) domain-containing protein [Pseudarcicella hirudinis]|uniref:Acetyltransferase (GNAT) domain-containing protein n=1 Tax=Pseudarcicella hirudinis TaxID=1079859 RepID=A0A1I5VXW2_9BACT|nr:GNAT family N-acetyltransferase [Pseudarcicella hirudinis]SFQ12364.1 Acetyltransferase (GNAT) domain-containing protein [Pseudarcicella hirudinis]